MKKLISKHNNLLKLIICLFYAMPCAFSQTPVILRINCSGIKETSSILSAQGNKRSELAKFMLSVNTITGRFNIEGYTLVGIVLDTKSDTPIFKITDDNLILQHRYFNEIKDPLDAQRKASTQMQTTIDVNRFDGTATIQEILTIEGTRPSLQIIQGRYECIQINERKF
jgi:hypothetical protein